MLECVERHEASLSFLRYQGLSDCVEINSYRCMFDPVSMSHGFRKCRASLLETVKCQKCECKSSAGGRFEYCPDLAQNDQPPFEHPTFSFPPSLEVATRKPTKPSSKSLASLPLWQALLVLYIDIDQIPFWVSQLNLTG